MSEVVFIERVNIIKRIEDISRSLSWKDDGRDLEKIRDKAKKLFYKLDVKFIRRYSPTILSGGLIRCAAILLQMKPTQQEIADTSFCIDVSISNVKKAVFRHLGLDKNLLKNN